MPASNVKRINEQRIGKHLEGTVVVPSHVRTGGLCPYFEPLTSCTPPDGKNVALNVEFGLNNI